MLRLLLLMLPIGFYTNALKLSFDTGIPGLNIANLIFLLALAAVLAGKPQPGMPARSEAMLAKPMLAYFAMATIGFFIAQFTMPIDLAQDLTDLKNYMFYPLFYFLYRRCNLNEKETRLLIIFVMFVAAVAALQAVRQGLDYGFGRYSDARRASGPFGIDWRNANRAGVFYAMYMPMFVAIALFCRDSRLWRLIAIACIGLTTVAIMATYSRQAYLIALVAVALLAIRKSLILATLIALVCTPAIALLPDSVTQRVEQTEQKNEAGTAQGVDDSTASRFDIWAGAMQMVKEHSAGVGLRRFPKHIGDYTDFPGYDAHNFYVLTVAELGPLGLAALLWLLWRAWKLSTRVRRGAERMDTETQALGIGFSVMVIAAALGNLYGSPFPEGGVMTNFWILCGLLEYYIALRSRTSTTAPNQHTSDRRDASIGERFPLAAGIAPGRYRRADTPARQAEGTNSDVRADHRTVA